MKNKTKKTNYDYVKEFLKGNDEALEFLEAMLDENDNITDDLNDQLESLAIEKYGLQIKLDLTEGNVICDSQIDFGICLLHYATPDSLKIGQFMEELKDKYETKANFSQLKLAV